MSSDQHPNPGATPDPAPCPVIAVDGGGTRCRIALDTPAGRHEIEGGSVNVGTDFDGAVDEILRCFTKLSNLSGWPLADLYKLPIYLGLAGVIDPAIIPRLHATLPFPSVKIEDDQPAAVKGVLGTTDGFMAHCGTGSFFATQLTGTMRFYGGWGHILGDPASAMWVGRTALSRSLDTVDGLAPPSDLAEYFLDRFNGAPGLVTFATTASPADFGQLAKEVTRFAAKGDALAMGLLQTGADTLADTLTKLGWSTGKVICLTGGIGPEFAAYLPEAMQADLTPAKATPLSGAITLARAYGADLQAGAPS